MVLLHHIPSAASIINPATDLVYLGAFRLPKETSAGTYGYGGEGMTYNPKGDPDGAPDGFPGSLFSIGHPYQGHVGEFTIPSPVVSAKKDLSELPIAQALQSFHDVTGGRQTHGLTGTVLGDIQYLPKQSAQSTDKLYWVMYEFYMPPPERLTLGWCELDISNPNSQGAWSLYPPFACSATSKYLFEVPQKWADTYLQGEYLAVGRFRIVNDGSWGPALFSIAPWKAGNPPADGSTLNAHELLRYTREHRINHFSFSDGWNDGAWLEAGNKSAIIFAGRKSERTAESGLEYYGASGPDGCGSKGYHGEPYYGCILFYNPDDLVAVVQGKMKPYEPQPYAMYQIENVLFKGGQCRANSLAGVGYDRANNLLYVLEMLITEPYERAPICHVWRIKDAISTPDTQRPSTPSNLKVLSANQDQISIMWDKSTDDTGGIMYIVYRNNVPVAITTDAFFTDTKISNFSPPFQYSVVASDSVNNRSCQSKTMSVESDSSYHYETIDSLRIRTSPQ
jgi:hypothetical protein